MTIIIVMLTIFIVVYSITTLYQKKFSKLTDEEREQKNKTNKRRSFNIMLVYLLIGIIVVILSQTFKFEVYTNDHIELKQALLVMGLIFGAIGGIGAIFTYNKLNDK